MASKQPIFTCSTCKAGKNLVSFPQGCPVIGYLTRQNPIKNRCPRLNSGFFEQQLQSAFNLRSLFKPEIQRYKACVEMMYLAVAALVASGTLCTLQIRSSP